MKKFIYLLIIFGTITITWLTSVMASFTVQSIEIVQKNEVVSFNQCCEESNEKEVKKMNILCNDWWICSDGSICECCISPSNNYPLFSRTNNVNLIKNYKKNKILDYTFIDLLQEALDTNLVTQLNSHPEISEQFIPDTLYLSLIGSIKSNC